MAPSLRRLPALIALLTAALAACDDEPRTPEGPPALFTAEELAGMHEMVPCRHSHEHELRHIRIFADAAAAPLYHRCVLFWEPCEQVFPPGALFVKLEYDREGCRDEEFVGYTASRKLDPGSYPEGFDWRWQKLDPDLKVVQDGAPPVCLRCHIDHCTSPEGHDLRCTPD